ncbi:tyrosinase family protein [Actinoplanes sp. NPDC051859]|uniref:tyrosinase family protein n=1 Tax=Actinoplanes sp. NPDC051859 TaxID=3363909 RepID=UPI0037904A82
MGVRKDQSKLTTAERKAFVDAVLKLKNDGVVLDGVRIWYDDFVLTHNRFIGSDTDQGRRIGHRSPSFLPWHREYLRSFERALQTIDPTVNLPYWNWTVDRTAGAPIWNEDFMGGNGDRRTDGRVTNGPFAHSKGKWNITRTTDSNPRLRRSLGVGGTLPTVADLDRVKALKTYDVTPWNSASSFTTGFRNALEGWRPRPQPSAMHNAVHVWVGGNMAGGASPNDPVFWLHHCFIDKIWSDWQQTNPNVSYTTKAELDRDFDNRDPRTNRDNRDNIVHLDKAMAPPERRNEVGEVIPDNFTVPTMKPSELLSHTAWYTYE